MKIVEHTSERLVLEHFPWIMGGFVWFMALAAFGTGIFGINTAGVERIFLICLGAGGMVFAAIFFPFVRISFDRQNRMVTRRRGHIDRARELKIPFERISRIRQEANWSDGARLTRLVLEMKDDSLTPLETGFSSSQRDQIERELQKWFEAAMRNP